MGLLTSCDPGTSESFFLENNSDYEVTVKYENWESDSVILVPPQKNQLIYHSYAHLGTAHDLGEDFLDWADTLSLTIDDSLKIKKNYLDRSNWSLKIIAGEDGLTDGGESLYTLTIDNGDIDE